MLAYQVPTPTPPVVVGESASPRVDGVLASEVLNLLNVGLILVSSSGQVLGANDSASRCLESRDGLWDEEGLLAAEAVTETLQLRGAIREASEKGKPGGMLIRRSRDAQPHMVMLQPVTNGDSDQVVIAVRSGGAKSAGLADRVKALFRLGPAEADIAVQLARGSDIQEIAIVRGVTINTIRTQLASAMVKVGVRRQAELVAAVAGLDVLA
jgi:DNA-binding CsgD family transcriptional regulator